MKARIRSRAVVMIDRHFVDWRDNGEVFDCEPLSHSKPPAFRLTAPGYGHKDNYGAGAIYAREDDLIGVWTREELDEAKRKAKEISEWWIGGKAS